MLTFLTAGEHNGRAFERFTQHGPLAMLPMSNGRCSLVWCHPQDKAADVEAWSDDRFCTELQKAFGWRLGRITHAGKRAVYPLSLTTASQSISHRVALVGNAAQTLHPIAGQGFNLGLRDVMSLAETLSQAWHEQKIAARIRCSAIIRSDAGPIKKRLSASPMAWYICLPIAGHRWLQAATLG